MKKLSSREVVMLACLGVVVVLAGYYLLLFQPLQIKLAASAEELVTTEELLDVARTKESEGLEIKKNLAANEELWNSINARLPEGFMVADIIDMMAAARSKHNIEDRFLQYRFSSKTPVRENVLTMVDIDITLTAEYETIMAFIETFLQNEKLACRVINYSAVMSSEEGTPLNKLVTAQFRMQILFRVPAEERAAAEAAAAATAAGS